MAAGKPVVASRAGGMPSLVSHGQNGLLVQTGNETELADAIVELLSDPERARSMGRQGRQDCTKFSLDAMVSKIDQLYQNLLHQRTEPGLN